MRTLWIACVAVFFLTVSVLNAQIMINEVLYDTQGNDDPNLLFTELYGPPGTNLDGYSLVGINGNGGAQYRTVALSGTIPPDGYFVVGNTAIVTNVDLIIGGGTGAGVDWQNAGSASGDDCDCIELQLLGTAVDKVRYGPCANPPGCEGEGGTNAPDSSPSGGINRSIGRLPDHQDTDDNAADWGTPVTLTPGEPNEGSPCDMQTYTISQIQEDNADGTPTHLGEFVHVSGIATIDNYVLDPTTTSFYMQDDDAGVSIFGSTGTVDVVPGDVVVIEGWVSPYNGLTEITPSGGGNCTWDIEVVDQTDVPDPLILLCNTIATLGEEYEGMLVKIECVTIVGGDPWPTEGENANIVISDETGTCILRIDRDTDIDGQTQPPEPFDITGIATQYDWTSPYTEGYQILPRDYDDFSDCSGALADISGTVGYHASGLPIGGIAMDINPGGSTTTSILGLYHFVDMAINTSYMVTPDGSSETSCDACISFYDASLAAQFAIGLIELDLHQQHAADVSGNGDVTFYDASLIAQYAIGLITEWPCDYNWCFDPSSRSYNPLTGDETGEDYDGMCLGDVSGNWSGVFLAGASQRELRLQDGFTADGIFSVKNVGDQAAYAIEFDCRYDPSQLRFEGAELAEGIDDWHLYTRAEAGVIHVGAFGVTPVGVGHDIVRLQFQPIEGGHAVSGLQVDEYRVNESTIMSGSVSGMLLPIPKAYSLEQNYPNPFNPITNIRYSLPEMAGVRLTVFNMLGEQVAVLVDKIQEAGNYNVTFDGSHLSSGIYFYHLEAGDFHQIRKMILLK